MADQSEGKKAANKPKMANFEKKRKEKTDSIRSITNLDIGYFLALTQNAIFAKSLAYYGPSSLSLLYRDLHIKSPFSSVKSNTTRKHRYNFSILKEYVIIGQHLDL